MSESPLLYLLSPPSGPFLGRLEELFEAGVDWFQYRRVHPSDPEALEELDRVLRIAGEHDVRVIVNDRPDLALAAGAAGVHLGGEDLPPGAVKSRWRNLTVGATQRAGEPLAEGADYYGVGPVFETSSKRLDAETCGWSGVRDVLGRTDRPVFAIGGIRSERLEDVPDGLRGVAVLSGVWEADDPAGAAAHLKDVLRGAMG